MFSAHLQSISALCVLQVLFFFNILQNILLLTSQSAKTLELVSKQRPTMLCKYHVFISSLVFTTFKCVCSVSAAPSGRHLAADLQAACVNIFQSFHKVSLFVACISSNTNHNCLHKKIKAVCAVVKKIFFSYIIFTKWTALFSTLRVPQRTLHWPLIHTHIPLMGVCCLDSLGSIGVHCLAQGHLNMQTVGAGI